MERYLRERLRSSKFDNVDAVRSKTMSSIRGKGNKTTELVVRMALVRSGISGWEMHPTDIKGKPDFYFRTKRTAVFVDGCFWHGCERCGHTPHTRSEFWTAKFERNHARDLATRSALGELGIKVLGVWEHQLKTPEGIREVVGDIKFSLRQSKSRVVA
jgi:DNA mismatch endonuclease (patch repair protein)